MPHELPWETTSLRGEKLAKDRLCYGTSDVFIQCVLYLDKKLFVERCACAVGLNLCEIKLEVPKCLYLTRCFDILAVCFLKQESPAFAYRIPDQCLLSQ